MQISSVANYLVSVVSMTEFLSCSVVTLNSIRSIETLFSELNIFPLYSQMGSDWLRCIGLICVGLCIDGSTYIEWVIGLALVYYRNSYSGVLENHKYILKNLMFDFFIMVRKLNKQYAVCITLFGRWQYYQWQIVKFINVGAIICMQWSKPRVYAYVFNLIYTHAKAKLWWIKLKLYVVQLLIFFINHSLKMI